ncbi:MAG: Holliday junction resolvase RuvX [Gammaproteobacteria bacterium]|nr:MAG: Holliday junction resolvase RuvX [Gammaproteobacteria bacterium]
MSSATVIGFDYGTKRIGVAVGNTITKTAGPLTTIFNNPQTFDNIQKIIKAYNPGVLLVGLPLKLDGNTQPMTKLSQKFAQQLEQHFKITPIMCDERLSSYQAENMLIEKRKTGLHKKKLKKTDIDKISAVVIVEQWLATYQTNT